MTTLVMDPRTDRRILTAMIRNWPLMAARGALAVLFGLALLVWPDVTLPAVVVLFGVYALADGALALAAASRGALRVLEAWPVALEGLMSLVIGVLALVAPLRLPRDFIAALALWGIATGLLEVVYAAWLPRTSAGSWLLGAAGVSSLVLAALVLTLTFARVESVVPIIATYTLVFGIALAAGAFAVRGRALSLTAP